MGANDDIHNVKRTHLNCFQMHTIFEQIYPKPAIEEWGTSEDSE